MNKIDTGLIEEAKKLVTFNLTNELSEKCLFHTIDHTIEVLNNAEIIGRFSKLKENDLNILRMSALFHDVGYIDAYDGHEVFSASRAKVFLKSKNVDKESINQIEAAILSTRVPQSPRDEVSRILCDSDLMYLTFDNYLEQIELMRIEWQKVGKAKLNRHQFHLISLEFSQSHRYHTEYGKKVLQPKKEKNEIKIKNKVLIDK